MMPRYMVQGGYTSESVARMVQSPQDRSTAAKAITEALGGKLLEFYFTFGQDDFLAIAELPDDVALTTLVLAIGASGALHGVHTTKLLTVEESMEAMRKAQSVMAAYRPPTA